MSSQLDKNSAALAALVEYAGTLPPASSSGEVTAESITEALGYTPADAANVVQHTAQTLTEAQKTQARENIGAEKVAAKYELIETITVEEEGISQIVRTSESLDAVIVTMMAPPRSAGNADAFVQAKTNTGKSIVVGAGYIKATETFSSRYDVWKNANLWEGKSCGQVKGWGGGNTLGTNNASNLVLAADGECINYLCLYASGSGTYPVGTVIKIYGVRADA